MAFQTTYKSNLIIRGLFIGGSISTQVRMAPSPSPGLRRVFFQLGGPFLLQQWQCKAIQKRSSLCILSSLCCSRKKGGGLSFSWHKALLSLGESGWLTACYVTMIGRLFLKGCLIFNCFCLTQKSSSAEYPGMESSRMPRFYLYNQNNLWATHKQPYKTDISLKSHPSKLVQGDIQ